MPDKMPVFVKIDDYRDIMDILGVIKDRLRQARTILQKITDIKNKEDSQIDTWDKEVSDVEGKIQDIDKTLLEPEHL